MIKYTKIGFVAYPVTRISRARKFYEGVLGFKPSRSFPVSEKSKFLEYDIGPTTLAIGSSPLWKPSKHGPSVALEVKNFDETVAHLKKCRIKFIVGPVEFPTCRMAAFRDPDGNTISIHQRKRR